MASPTAGQNGSCGTFRLIASPRSESRQRWSSPRAASQKVTQRDGQGLTSQVFPSPVSHGQTMSMTTAMAEMLTEADFAQELQKLRQRLVAESQKRVAVLLRLEAMEENFDRLRGDLIASNFLSAGEVENREKHGAGWWDLATQRLGAHDEKLSALDEQVRAEARSREALEERIAGLARDREHGALASSKSEKQIELRLAAVETSIEQIQREVSSSLMGFRQTDELIVAQRAELQNLLERWEQRFDFLRSEIEIGNSRLRLDVAKVGNEKDQESMRRKETEHLLVSLLGDLNGLRQEYHTSNANAEAAFAAASKTGLQSPRSLIPPGRASVASSSCSSPCARASLAGSIVQGGLPPSTSHQEVPQTPSRTEHDWYTSALSYFSPTAFEAAKARNISPHTSYPPSAAGTYSPSAAGRLPSPRAYSGSRLGQPSSGSRPGQPSSGPLSPLLSNGDMSHSSGKAL